MGRCTFVDLHVVIIIGQNSDLEVELVPSHDRGEGGASSKVVGEGDGG